MSATNISLTDIFVADHPVDLSAKARSLMQAERQGEPAEIASLNILERPSTEHYRMFTDQDLTWKLPFNHLEPFRFIAWPA